MADPKGDPSKPRLNWVYATLPVALATGQIGTIVQLHLIDLDGHTLGTIYSGLAVAFFSAVSIPAAIFWGYITDRLHERKGLIVASYFVMAMVLLAFFFEQDTAGTIAVYSVFSFISAASATPLNLLIMENEPKNAWADTFAKLSFASGVGISIGLVMGTVWVTLFPLIYLAFPLALASAASAVLSVSMMTEPTFVLERETITRRGASLISRLRSLPLFFIAVPRPSDFKKVFRGLRYGITSYVPLLYVSIVLFALSGGLFNPSWVPALSSFGFGSGPILLVILVTNVIQTIVFDYTGKFLARRSLIDASIQGLLLRGSCYVSLGICAVVVAGPFYVIPALIFYTLASGVGYAVYSTASNTMIFNSIQNRSPGSALGVYSAVVGIATTAGSLVSGFVSVYFGFDTTFIAAGLLAGAAVAVLFRIRRLESNQGAPHPIG